MDAWNFLGLFDDADTINQRRNQMKRFIGASCSAVLLLPSVRFNFAFPISSSIRLTQFCITIMKLVAFMTNLDDAKQALEALYYLSVQILVNAQFWCILSDLQTFNEIWNQVESMVLSSKG